MKMSIFSKLKQLFEKQEPKKDDNHNDKTEEKSESSDEVAINFKKPESPIQINSNPIDSMGSTSDAIKSWEKTIEIAKQHPLSQVKIINTQILEELGNVLKQMNNKLDELNKLDEILILLHETQSELKDKGVEPTAINKAIEEIERLTIKDKEVVSWIVKQERVTANQLAGYTGLSRSTASFRLNRLAELGVLEKEAIGKKIYYKPKNI